MIDVDLGEINVVNFVSYLDYVTGFDKHVLHGIIPVENQSFGFFIVNFLSSGQSSEFCI